MIETVWKSQTNSEFIVKICEKPNILNPANVHAKCRITFDIWNTHKIADEQYTAPTFSISFIIINYWGAAISTTDKRVVVVVLTKRDVFLSILMVGK